MQPTAVRSGMSRFLIPTIFLLAGLALAAMPSPTPAQGGTALKPAPLASPAGKDASEPRFTVQGNRVILSWIEGDEDNAALKFAERTATGWTAPQTVHSGSDMYVNAYDVPSVQALASGTLAAHWGVKNGDDPDASIVRVSWSTNQGRTWSAPVTPHHDGTESEHGFVSLFQAPGAGAGLGMVWLDGRAVKDSVGDMALRYSLYDAGGKQLREAAVDPRVCDCCSTSAAPTSDGVIVAYRDRSPAEIRDIYVTTFNGTGWSAPVLVHQDGWKINGCPINGPAVSASGRDVAVAWFTSKESQGVIQGQALVAFSHDAGRTFGPAVRIDDARSLGHVGVQLLADGSAAVTWVELADARAEFRARTVTPAGMRSPSVNVAGNGDPDTSSPHVAGNARELLFAWTETDDDGVSRVRTARSALAAK
jgi:hypothetical protein